MSLAWLEFIVILLNSYAFRLIRELADLLFGVII